MLPSSSLISLISLMCSLLSDPWYLPAPRPLYQRAGMPVTPPVSQQQAVLSGINMSIKGVMGRGLLFCSLHPANPGHVYCRVRLRCGRT